MNADPFIIMRSGAKMWFNHPEDSEFTIHDIALGLSHINRFGGQTYHLYSVAQHSCYVSDILDEPFKKWGLMHDATEALMGSDVCRPLKYAPGVEKIREFEKLAQIAIARKFGLPEVVPYEVKVADDQMFVKEQMHFFGVNDAGGILEDRIKGVQPANVRVVQWFPRSARQQFLQRFDQLFK